MHQEQSSNVKFIRMNTGEDLLAEVVTDDKDEKYIIINPLKLVYLLGERPGSMMLSLIEWVFPRICSNQQFEVYTSDVITLANPSDDIVDYYFNALSKLEYVDFKLDKDHDSISKLRSIIQREKEGNEEVDILNQVMEGLKSSKRKLH